jgi:hypothetical protein
MKKEIIYTDDYALIISDEKVMEGDFLFCIENKNLILGGITSGQLRFLDSEIFKKVIAHRPLTDAPILEGVALLPEFGESDNVEKLACTWFVTADKKNTIFDLGWINIFYAGYNKAKETYKYTEDDLTEAYERGMNNIDSDGCRIDQPADDFTEFIQSLQQPKRPKYFEVFYSSYKIDVDGNHVNELAIRTTAQGQTELVGEYSYE